MAEIRDFYGRIIARVEEKPNGDKVIRDFYNRILGYYVVALYNGLNNLKKLAYEDGKYLLRSCNDDKDSYPDINVNNLQVQGVAVCVMHSLIKQ